MNSQKIHQGIFISNQRRKGQGGRIKSNSITNKIEVIGFKGIHQSKVLWKEVRRYIKNDSKTNQNKKNSNNVKDKSNKKKRMYRLKQQIKSNVQLQCKNIKNNDDQKQDQQTINSIQQQENKFINEGQNKQKYKQKQKYIQKQKMIPNQEQTKQQKQIIVAKIIEQLQIPCKSNQFVGILKFTKKKQLKKIIKIKQNQNGKYISDILNDLWLDLIPINNRMPIMQIDSEIQNNLNILEKYVRKDLQIKGKKYNKILNSIMDILQGVYVSVVFVKRDHQYLMAKIIKIIGKSKTISGQCQCYLHQHHLNDFNYPSSNTEQSSSTNQLPLIHINPSQKHTKYKSMIFTIDPQTSMDLDDALSIEQLPNNIYQIGIHIADVTSYLHLLSRQDLSYRSNSIYLPHKVYHMLDKNIMQICSLNPQIQRLAFSIFIQINKNGQIIQNKSRIQKNIIQSRFKLNYNIVQNILDNKINYQQFKKIYYSCTNNQFNLLKSKLQNLNIIAENHKNKRVIKDVFINKEINFILDQQLWPINLEIIDRFNAQKLVQQFMIIGNIQAAKMIINYDPQNSLIIYHPKPSQLSLKIFQQNFSNFGMNFKFNTILEMQQQLMMVQNSEIITNEMKQFCYFKARRIQQGANYALYNDVIDKIIDKQGNKIIHFALGQQYYTHFTSPMRRMADIVVHQVLNQLIYKPNERIVVNPSQIKGMNDGRKYTKRLKKDLNEIYLCLLIYKTKQPFYVQGIITFFTMKSISIFIPKFDLLKELLWKKELIVSKVIKNKLNDNQMTILTYMHPQYEYLDLYWKLRKYDRIMVEINCTNNPPLRLKLTLNIRTTKNKKQRIQTYDDFI